MDGQRIREQFTVHRSFHSSAHALGGVSGVAPFITTDEPLQ